MTVLEADGSALMSNPYDTASERESILGPTLRFKGDLSAEENLVIQGQVEGKIGPVPRVTIGATAAVHATIDAGIVIVEGTVVGDIRAAASVIVRETAKLTGNISAPAVSILDGAEFNGQVSMGERRRVRDGQTAPKVAVA
jgi:cytoskeletal protein CcmA (bactofilin family)